MSLGFEQAGFHVMGAFDVEERHVETYRRNFPSSSAFVADLSKTTGDEIRQLAGIKQQAINVVFGGPPCQGFSMGGKRQANRYRPRDRDLHRV